jgi:hypothetical protein
VGRHRTAEEKLELGEWARQLRAAGRSRREIQAELGIGDDLAKKLLSGVPLPDSLRRPRAKDDVRAQAVEMRAQGATYDQIAAALGVSKSSCSLWLRDLPRPEEDPERAAAAEQRRTDALRARARRDRDARDELGAEVTRSAAEGVGPVSSRDLVLALAVSYWCEGSKTKPWNRQKLVKWMNSDPVLVTLFLEGLAVIGIGADRLSLRLHIHESADELAARTWWSEHTGVPLAQFRQSTIKRHNPTTVRQNTGDGYRGCLCITVLQSRRLYEILDGLVQGLATQPRALAEWQDDDGTPSRTA